MTFSDSFAVGFTYEKRAKYVGEFLGTLWLVLVIKLSVVHFAYPSISIGAGLCCIIYTYGYISKAHYNPSITLAFTIRNIDAWPRSDYCQIAMYYVAEYLGGIFGGLIAWMIGGDEVAMVYPTALNNGSSESVYFRAFMAEFIFTFFLAAVILHVATDQRQAKNQFYGAAIGLVVTTSIMCIGEISGSCLNSAVWLGCAIPAMLASDSIDLSDAWIYWTAPFIGAAVCALSFNVIFGKNSSKVPDDQCVSFASFSQELQTITNKAETETV